jgi:tRNA nucleotidyltransferase (CCA-adding enzyme)
MRYYLSSDKEIKSFLKETYDLGICKFEVWEVPELSNLIGIPAGPIKHHPEKDSYIHTKLSYNQAKKISNDPKVWYATLLHDLGKAVTNSFLWTKQYGHEKLGIPLVERVNNRLNVPEDWRQLAILVAENHLLAHTAENLNPKTLKKLFDKFKNIDQFNDYLNACMADARGRYGFEDSPYHQKDYLLNKFKEHIAGLP